MQRKHRMAVAFAVFGGALGIASSGFAQPITAGGKNTQALFDCVGFDADGAAAVEVTIPQGRSRKMLVVNAYARGVGAGTCEISTNLDVGTEDIFGGSSSGHQGGLDTTTGFWWGDFDALEAASPGEFLGQPVPVTLQLFRVASSTCGGVCVSFAVQVVKK